MNKNNRGNYVLWSVILIFAAAVSIIVLTILIIGKENLRSGQGYTFRDPGNASQVSITPNPGGSAPKPISPTSEPLVGMASPAFCKLEMYNISNKAHETGAAGILALNSYDVDRKICIFDIKNAKGIGNAGRLEVRRDSGSGEYETAVKAIKMNNQALQLWTETLLSYFHPDLSETIAGSCISQALDEGSSVSDLFSIVQKNEVLSENNNFISVRTLQIRGNVK